MRQNYLPLGTISEGTMRPEDVGEALASELGRLRLRRSDRKTVHEFWREYGKDRPDAE